MSDAASLRPKAANLRPALETRAIGLILRTRRLTETSLIVHWLTAEEGRVATVAKGALRPKSPFRGKLDLCYKRLVAGARDVLAHGA